MYAVMQDLAILYTSPAVMEKLENLYGLVKNLFKGY